MNQFALNWDIGHTRSEGRRNHNRTKIDCKTMVSLSMQSNHISTDKDTKQSQSHTLHTV